MISLSYQFKWVLGFAAVILVGQALYTLYDAQPSTASWLIQVWGLALAVSLWIKSDSRKTRYWPFDRGGMLLFFAWPISVPLYLLRTRGVRGIAPALFVVGLVIAPYIVYILVVFYRLRIGDLP